MGAGGGSIVWIDEGGMPHVGPKSAGASPGPVCYGAGGTQPTVTDANLLLGYLDDRALAGGNQGIDRGLALRAFEEKIAGPLGMDVIEAAWGVHALANVNMGKAIAAVSIERGRDPRDSTMIAFGGAGPMHAALLAEEFGIVTVIVPMSAGLFSAVGLQVADIRYDYSASFPTPAERDAALAERMFSELERRALIDSRRLATPPTMCRCSGCSTSAIVASHSTCVCRFPRARWMTTPLTRARGPSTASTCVPMAISRWTVPSTSTRRLRASAAASRYDKVDVPSLSVGGNERRRTAHFGPVHGSYSTPILERTALAGTRRPGPLIVQDMDCTTVVPLAGSPRSMRAAIFSDPWSQAMNASSPASARALDPMLQEVIKKGLTSLADDGPDAGALPTEVVRDNMDFSTAVFDAKGESLRKAS